LITECLKMQAYRRLYVNTYVWRRVEQLEIDLIEESAGCETA